jgi:membrane protein implicated in regulation of membrane protease activity
MNVIERMEQIMGIIFIIILGTGGVLTTLRTHWEEVELAWEVAGTLFAVVAVWKASAWWTRKKNAAAAAAAEKERREEEENTILIVRHCKNK